MPSTSQTQSPPHLMQCMEVWGGNRAIDNGVVMPGLDAWVYSRPFADAPSLRAGGAEAGREGGDVHYVTSCATGRITRLIVADVSGHGAAVSEIAVGLRRLMRKYSNYLDQSRFVAALNRKFGDLATGSDDFAGVFATAVVATYFAPIDELSLCNAGHPRPLLYRAKTRMWEVVGGKGAAESGDAGPANLPLGVIDPTRYDQQHLRLRKGDLALLYTDSLIEAKRADGRLLGEAGLVEIVGGVDASRPEVFISDLLGLIAAWTGVPDHVFNDDVTALLLRRNEMRPRVGIVPATMAGVRIVGSVLRSITRGDVPASWPDMRRQTIGGAMFTALNGNAEDTED